jgi:hypothetical protein
VLSCPPLATLDPIAIFRMALSRTAAATPEAAARAGDGPVLPLLPCRFEVPQGRGPMESVLPQSARGAVAAASSAAASLRDSLLHLKQLLQSMLGAHAASSAYVAPSLALVGSLPAPTAVAASASAPGLLASSFAPSGAGGLAASSAGSLAASGATAHDTLLGRASQLADRMGDDRIDSTLDYGATRQTPGRMVRSKSPAARTSAGPIDPSTRAAVLEQLLANGVTDSGNQIALSPRAAAGSPGVETRQSRGRSVEATAGTWGREHSLTRPSVPARLAATTQASAGKSRAKYDYAREREEEAVVWINPNAKTLGKRPSSRSRGASKTRVRKANDTPADVAATSYYLPTPKASPHRSARSYSPLASRASLRIDVPPAVGSAHATKPPKTTLLVSVDLTAPSVVENTRTKRNRPGSAATAGHPLVTSGSFVSVDWGMADAVAPSPLSSTMQAIFAATLPLPRSRAGSIVSDGPESIGSVAEATEPYDHFPLTDRRPASSSYPAIPPPTNSVSRMGPVPSPILPVSDTSMRSAANGAVISPVSSTPQSLYEDWDEPVAAGDGALARRLLISTAYGNKFLAQHQQKTSTGYAGAAETTLSKLLKRNSVTSSDAAVRAAVLSAGTVTENAKRPGSTKESLERSAHHGNASGGGSRQRTRTAEKTERAPSRTSATTMKSTGRSKSAAKRLLWATLFDEAARPVPEPAPGDEPLRQEDLLLHGDEEPAAIGIFETRDAPESAPLVMIVAEGVVAENECGAESAPETLPHDDLANGYEETPLARTGGSMQPFITASFAIDGAAANAMSSSSSSSSSSVPVAPSTKNDGRGVSARSDITRRNAPQNHSLSRALLSSPQPPHASSGARFASDIASITKTITVVDEEASWGEFGSASASPPRNVDSRSLTIAHPQGWTCTASSHARDTPMGPVRGGTSMAFVSITSPTRETLKGPIAGSRRAVTVPRSRMMVRVDPKNPEESAQSGLLAPPVPGSSKSPYVLGNSARSKQIETAARSKGNSPRPAEDAVSGTPVSRGPSGNGNDVGAKKSSAVLTTRVTTDSNAAPPVPVSAESKQDKPIAPRNITMTGSLIAPQLGGGTSTSARNPPSVPAAPAGGFSALEALAADSFENMFAQDEHGDLGLTELLSSLHLPVDVARALKDV